MHYFISVIFSLFFIGALSSAIYDQRCFKVVSSGGGSDIFISHADTNGSLVKLGQLSCPLSKINSINYSPRSDLFIYICEANGFTIMMSDGTGNLLQNSTLDLAKYEVIRNIYFDEETNTTFGIKSSVFASASVLVAIDKDGSTQNITYLPQNCFSVGSNPRRSGVMLSKSQLLLSVTCVVKQNSSTTTYQDFLLEFDLNSGNNISTKIWAAPSVDSDIFLVAATNQNNDSAVTIMYASNFFNTALGKGVNQVTLHENAQPGPFGQRRDVIIAETYPSMAQPFAYNTADAFDTVYLPSSQYAWPVWFNFQPKQIVYTPTYNSGSTSVAYNTSFYAYSFTSAFIVDCI